MQLHQYTCLSFLKAMMARFHMKVKVDFSFPTLKPILTYCFKVLPANWLLHSDLVTKRIWAHICNTETNPFDGGFARGRYEGQRVLVTSREGEGDVMVSTRQHPLKIPAKFLFPDKPTSKGQDMVVISGDGLGEVYLTRKLRVDGFFPLGCRGHTSSPICIMEASRLARCDPLSKLHA
jgi:hypothetical protein